MEITVWIDKYSRPSFKVGTLCLYPFIVPPCDHFVAVSNIKKVHVGTLLKSGPSLIGFGAVQQFCNFKLCSTTITFQTLRCPHRPQRPRCHGAASRAARRAPSPPTRSEGTEKSHKVENYLTVRGKFESILI